jgi:MtrB/PioB family decaheme-associated outer membrane protein
MRTLRTLLLAGSALAASVAAIALARAADLSSSPNLPALSSPDTLGWSIDHASADFGGQAFIEKPGSSPSNSLAKFNQYGTLTNPVFLNFFDVGAQGQDYKYTFEALGKNVGTDNQEYEVDLNQPGQQYLNLGWYEVPDLRSNTAQTLYYGVGGGNLWIPPTVVQQLYTGIFNGGTYANGPGNNSKAPVQNQLLGIPPGAANVVPFGCYLPGQTGTLACKKGVTPVQTTVNNNVHTINLGIQRDAGEIDYRWTPTPNWDFQAGYTNEHRYGTQEQGFLFSNSTSTPMAAVPAPVDDYTQSAFLQGEYYGTSPWGMKWNGLVRYNASIYTDSMSSFTAENPFGGPGSPASGVPHCPIASATAAANNCYGWGQMGTEPNNASNMITAQLGVDLPGFVRNRYMGTFSFDSMTQNESFIPMTINSLGDTGFYPYSKLPSQGAYLAPVPQSSLDGQINTTLFNNVVTTQIIPSVQNKLSYRYYSDDNNTPPLTLQNWIVNDSTLASSNANSVGSGGYGPHTTLLSSYTKQNASDQITWNPVSWATVGASGGWEQYQYSQYAANYTNELQGTVFGTFKPTDYLTIRVNDQFGWRRYSDYNWQEFIGNVMLAGTVQPGGMTENPYLADFNIANRNRNVGNLYLDYTTPIAGLTITPTVGWRWDNYPTDIPLIQAGGNGLGLNADHHWNAGIEADWAVNTTLSLTGSYTFENIQQVLYGTSTSSTAPASLTVYNSSMGQNVNTWLAGATFQLIPDRLALKLSGTYELALGNWNTGPGSAGCLPINAAGSSCGIVSPGNPAYPAENTTYTHFDASLTYKVDPAYLTQFGKGEVYLQLKYMYERNDVTNWQTSGMTPYMYSTLNSSTVSFKDMIFMAGDNPNYTAQAIMASLMVKW